MNLIFQLIASPLAFGSVYFEPVGALVSLAISYFFAEMWFGILFAILVEIVPLAVRSTTLGVFLFVMNNIGGNLPVLVEPLSKAIGYRESLWVFFPGAFLLCEYGASLPAPNRESVGKMSLFCFFSNIYMRTPSKSCKIAIL